MKIVEIVTNPFTEEEIASVGSNHRTYKMDFENKRIAGMTNGIDAVFQSILKIFNTQRFAHRIYSDQYGCDIFNKIGQIGISEDFLKTDIPAMLADALVPEDAVIEITDLIINKIDSDGVEIDSFIKTIYGNTKVKGVIVNG